MDKQEVSVVQPPFQLTAARRRLAKSFDSEISETVSTHSRPKAAGRLRTVSQYLLTCFNSQPPEGGWGFALAVVGFPISFNSQPPEGGWLIYAAATVKAKSFNSQPPEGGWCQ